MKISKPNDVFDELLICLRRKTLIPIFGAGLSCGAPTKSGKVPSGSEYRNYMISELKKEQLSEKEKDQLDSSSFSQVSDFYEDLIDESKRCSYLNQNFSGVALDETRKKALEVQWPYIYTLNIDDAIEKNSSYQYVILPNREFKENIFDDSKCVIKLHGDVSDILSYKDSKKVFSSKEYAISILDNKTMLNKLRTDYHFSNIVFIGCSLDDENDLKTLDNVIRDKTDSYSNIYYFTTSQPNRLKESKLKSYGVTNIVVFDSHDNIYEFLSFLGAEAEKINDSELNNYRNIPVLKLQRNAKDNSEYFYYGKLLYNKKKRCLVHPFYFIERDVSHEILKNLNNSKINLVFGNRISGKTYLLTDLYSKIKDREVFYFDGRNKLNANSFCEILKMKDTIILLDVGVLERDQFETILVNANKINKNHTSFVICLNNNDSDAHGILKWKANENPAILENICSYKLENKFLAQETKKINQLLPYINLPPFYKDKTIMDNLLAAETDTKVSGQFSSKCRLNISSCKELAFLIVLATKEKIYSSDLTKFDFENILGLCLNKYEPFIEYVESDSFETNISNLSSIKIVINSKFWLYRSLGIFALNRSNDNLIVDAYRYIIRKLIENSGNTNLHKRKACREYILFDVINRIFLNEAKGQLSLIARIYEGLHSLLAEDYHYLHQFSKCRLKQGYQRSDNNSAKEQILEDGLALARISASMIDREQKESRNERLLISLAHVQYTIASFQSELCRIHGYKDEFEVKDTIESIIAALCSEYNKEDYLRDKKNRRPMGIIRFTHALIEDDNKTSILLKNDCSEKLSLIVNMIRILDQ